MTIREQVESIAANYKERWNDAASLLVARAELFAAAEETAEENKRLRDACQAAYEELARLGRCESEAFSEVYAAVKRAAASCALTGKGEA